MAKPASAGFDRSAFVAAKDEVESLRSKLTKLSSSKARAAERMAQIDAEISETERNLRARTAEMDALSKKGIASVLRNHSNSPEIIDMLLRLTEAEGAGEGAGGEGGGDQLSLEA